MRAVSAFRHDDAPGLNIDVLLSVLWMGDGCITMSFGVVLRGVRSEERHGDTIEVSSQLSASQMEECWCEVGVARYHVFRKAHWDAWAPDHHGDVDVFFEGALLSWLEAVLADVVAVVGGVEDVRVVEQVVSFQPRDNAVDHLIDGL